MTVGAIPEIFPGNYCLLDGVIVFRTREGAVLAAATRRTVLAFELLRRMGIRMHRVCWGPAY
jgi:hypothetical protein